MAEYVNLLPTVQTSSEKTEQKMLQPGISKVNKYAMSPLLRISRA
jgi:hypothetical protein